MKNVLFLCTHNSARSILAEVILNAKGGTRYRGFSAGSAPRSAPNPYGIAYLESRGHRIDGLYSKSWDVFAAEGAPEMHIIITVCDDAAGESCPVWPGRPATGHWGIADPSAVGGSFADRQAAFARAYGQLEERIDRLLALPDDLDGAALKAALNAIGAQSDGATERSRRAAISARGPVTADGS
ncbi:MAG: arsenate reductase ArsC [Bauldia sp.]|nr:arsenate reductase ArsC [Bauldia sp.]MCW5716435.1 arsenate reductase ArsC [Bauldia sp.]